MKEAEVIAIRERVYDFYRDHARVLPWRRVVVTPFEVVISEVMLQQTQVPRVIEKFTSWVQRFPGFSDLAEASLSEVLAEWQGLGYNRRGKFLWELAKVVMDEYEGVLPDDVELLEKLPGIGPATARSICVYAFNAPLVYIETNIRSVFIHECFGEHDEEVSDEQLRPLVAACLDVDDPRRWYSALMDYGTMLKKLYGNPNRRSKHHVVQSKFEGSDRQVRGKILRALLADGKVGLDALVETVDDDRTERIAGELVKEEMVACEDGMYWIAG